MTLEQLDYFIHVATTGSFSQSAKALGISQPSLSRQIGQLENSLGQTLFDRYHRPLKLTAAGLFFFNHVQKNLGEIHQAIALTRTFQKSTTPNTLTIGFVASILYGLLPDIIARLKQTLPTLTIRLVEVSSDAQIQALKEREIDVGFGRFLCDDVFVKQIFLRHERFVVALPIRHPLASRDDGLGVSLKELMNDTLILYHRTLLPTQDGQSDPLLHLFHQHHQNPKHLTKTRDIQIALGLVSAGEGITLVPDSLETVRNSQIRYLPLHHENATSPIYMNLLAEPHPYVQPLLDATCAIYQEKGIAYNELATGQLVL